MRPGYGEGRSVKEVMYACCALIRGPGGIRLDSRSDEWAYSGAQAKLHLPRKTQAMEAGPGEFSFKRWRMERHL